jgi:excisionase family DNA binding protein
MNGTQVRSAVSDSMSEPLKEFEMSAVVIRGELPLLMCVKDVAKLLGVSVRTVWRLVSAGELPKPCSIGQCSRWHREDVEKFVTALRKSSSGDR